MMHSVLQPLDWKRDRSMEKYVGSWTWRWTKNHEYKTSGEVEESAELWKVSWLTTEQWTDGLTDGWPDKHSYAWTHLKKVKRIGRKTEKSEKRCGIRHKRKNEIKKKTGIRWIFDDDPVRWVRGAGQYKLHVTKLPDREFHQGFGELNMKTK